MNASLPVFLPMRRLYAGSNTNTCSFALRSLTGHITVESGRHGTSRLQPPNLLSLRFA